MHSSDDERVQNEGLFRYFNPTKSGWVRIGLKSWEQAKEQRVKVDCLASIKCSKKMQGQGSVQRNLNGDERQRPLPVYITLGVQK